MADHKPLYRWSLQDAVTHNEVQDWRDSYRENCDCARAIERAIADQYHDNILENGTKDIIDRYGFDRVNWVLANTLQEKAHDDRFSQDNKRWAKGFFIPSDDVRWHFCVESHPGLTDLFINQTREAWQKLGLFDASHCSEDNDYAGKLLILKPSVLKDEFKASDYQLFYAESGFGCSPTASGRKVFGKFLKDGENTSFNRSDFLGVIKDECIDRSVDSFDFAMRRRFRFVELKADERLEMLASLDDEALQAEAIRRMAALNKEITAVEDLNENYQIGASYFLKLRTLTFDQLWTDYLQPLLQEYVQGMYDEGSIMNRFAKAYGYKKPSEGDADESAKD